MEFPESQGFVTAEYPAPNGGDEIGQRIKTGKPFCVKEQEAIFF